QIRLRLRFRACLQAARENRSSLRPPLAQVDIARSNLGPAPEEGAEGRGAPAPLARSPIRGSIAPAAPSPVRSPLSNGQLPAPEPSARPTLSGHPRERL